IVLMEGAFSDFSVGADQTFILTLPDGWQFNTAAAADVSFTAQKDITAASLTVGTNTVTVTFSVGGTHKGKQHIIIGLQGQPLDGSLDPNAGYILNLSANPGSAVIAGIQQDSTTFGFLNTTPGSPVRMAIVTQPPAAATAGAALTPHPDVMTYD